MGRSRIENPEAVVAGVMFGALEGTRSGGGSRYQLQNELSVGNLLQRDALGLHWVGILAAGRLVGSPSIEYRHDQSYGRDLTEWRRSRVARGARFSNRRGPTYSGTARGAAHQRDRCRLRAGPQRGAARCGARSRRLRHLRHARRLRAGGPPIPGFRRAQPPRARPLRVRQDRDGGLSWGLDGFLLRRVTLASCPPAATTGGRAPRSTANVRLPGAWSLTTRRELDPCTTTSQDSALYFDYSVLRVRRRPRFEQVLGFAAVGRAARC